MTPNQLRSALAQLGLSQRAAARLLDIDERCGRSGYPRDAGVGATRASPAGSGPGR
jgi:hypothetical protein